MSDFPEIRRLVPLTIKDDVTECLLWASAVVNALRCLSQMSQQPCVVVPVSTRTLQVSQILGDLPVECWDVKPGHLTVVPALLPAVLDLTLLTSNPVPLAAQQSESPWGPMCFLAVSLR